MRLVKVTTSTIGNYKKRQYFVLKKATMRVSSEKDKNRVKIIAGQSSSQC